MSKVLFMVNAFIVLMQLIESAFSIIFRTTILHFYIISFTSLNHVYLRSSINENINLALLIYMRHKS